MLEGGWNIRPPFCVPERGNGLCLSHSLPGGRPCHAGGPGVPPSGAPFRRAGWGKRAALGFGAADGLDIPTRFALPKRSMDRCHSQPEPAGFGGAGRKSAGEAPAPGPTKGRGRPASRLAAVAHPYGGGTSGPFSRVSGKLPPTSMRFHWRGKSAAASRMTGAGPMMTPKRRGNAHPPTVSRLRERGMGGDPIPIRNAFPRQRTDGKRKLSFACLCCKNCILWIFCCLFSGDLLQ